MCGNSILVFASFYGLLMIPVVPATIATNLIFCGSPNLDVEQLRENIPNSNKFPILNTITGSDETKINEHKVERSIRLPNTTYPLRYHLHITTNIHSGNLDFSGNCTIEILVKHNTSELVLHSSDLNIHKILIHDLTTNISIDNVVYNQDGDLLNIRGSSSSKEGEMDGRWSIFEEGHQLRVEIHYDALINQGTTGLHRISDIDPQGRTVFGAVTHFEPIHARTVLPCYDEPYFKSKFLLRLTHARNLTAVSNVPQMARLERSDSEMVTSVFEATPKMSVYLLAFTISNYKNISIEADGLLQRVFFPPNGDFIDYLELLTNGASAMHTFSKMMGISYPLPKLDHFFIKEAYSSGMENWGLIIYNTSVIRKGPQKQYKVRFSQNHEIVHQWFGNLVTIDWWSYIWLNEGFASYYTYILMDKLSPEYNSLNELRLVCKSMLQTKNLTVIQSAQNEENFEDLFKTGVYEKAPCIIQMFDHAFGEEVFRKSLSNYLKKHMYSSVNENHLFDELQSMQTQHYAEHSRSWNLSVHEIIRNWTEAKSTPIIYVNRNYDEKSSQIVIKQKPTLENDGRFFWIPINFVTSSNPDFEHKTSADYYIPPIAEVTLDLNDFNLTLQPDDWLIVNKQNTGLYKVVYDKTNLRTIIKKENYVKIHPLNRHALFASLDEYDLQEGLELVKCVEHEHDAFVSSIIYTDLTDYLIAHEDKPEVYGTLYNLFRVLLGPHYRALRMFPFESRSLMQQNMFDELSYLACLVDLKECLDDRRDLVLRVIAGIPTPYAGYIDLWICSASKVFTVQEYELALKYFAEKINFSGLVGLACIRNEELYRKLMSMIFDIKKDDEECENKLKFIGGILISNNVKKSFADITLSLLMEKIDYFRTLTNCSKHFFDELERNYEYKSERGQKKIRELINLYYKLDEIDVNLIEG